MQKVLSVLVKLSLSSTHQIISDGREDMLEIYSRPGLTGLYTGKGPILDEWEISTDDVIVDELLGEGAFGEVYKGVIRGPLENPKISAVLRQAIGVPVAIKLLKSKPLNYWVFFEGNAKPTKVDK